MKFYNTAFLWSIFVLSSVDNILITFVSNFDSCLSDNLGFLLNLSNNFLYFILFPNLNTPQPLKFYYVMYIWF